MNNKEHYILFCIKNDSNQETIFYVNNIDPLLFTDDISKAKKYTNKILALNCKLDNAYTLKAKGFIDSMFVGVMEGNNVIGRIRLI